MRKLLIRLLALLAFVGIAHADGGAITPLKSAFQKARAERNIDFVLPVLLKSKLFIVGANVPEHGEKYFLTSSPNKERMCVTVSENAENLHKVAWPKFEVTGEQLLKELPPAIEIVVVYKDGGDYITREHLSWYRSLLKP